MSFGLTIPVLAVARPEGLNGKIDLEEIGRNYGTLSKRIHGGIDRLKEQIIDLHERVHFLDAFSTPIGCCVFLLDNARIFATLNLFNLINQYPISLPIRLPIANYILNLKSADPILHQVASDAIRLRNAAEFIKLIYYGSIEAYGYRIFPKKNGLDKAASLIPLFNRHFFYPDISENDDIYSKNFPFDTHDIMEALSLFSECRWIDNVQFTQTKEERDRVLGIFPRKVTASLLFNRLSHLPCLKESLLHRYVLWKSLLGLTCIPNGFDHGHRERIPFCVQHPTLRLKRLWSVLSDGSMSIPRFVPYIDNIEDLFEFDRELSRRSGLESIIDLKKLFSKFQINQSWSQLNQVEELIAQDIKPFYEHLVKVFNTIWDNLDDFLCFSLLGLKLAEKDHDINKSNNWMNATTPFIQALPGGVVTVGDTKQEENLNFTNSLMRFLALELDSFKPLGLFERYIGSIIVKQPNGQTIEARGLSHEEKEILKNSICKELSGYKIGDIDWQNRLTVPIEETLQF